MTKRERQLSQEIKRLHRFTMLLAERLAAASEVLGHLAERKRRKLSPLDYPTLHTLPLKKDANKKAQERIAELESGGD